MGCWGVEVLGYSDAGLLSSWGTGMLSYWDIQLLECLTVGMLECSTTGMLSCWDAGLFGCWDAWTLGCSTTGMLGCSSAGLLPTLPDRVLFRATRSSAAARRFGRSSAPGAVRVPLAPPRTARRAAAPLFNAPPPGQLNPIKQQKSTNPKTGKKTKLSLKSDTTPHGMTQAAISRSGGLLACTPALTWYGMQRMRIGYPQPYGMCGQCPQLVPGCLGSHQLYLEQCSQRDLGLSVRFQLHEDEPPLGFFWVIFVGVFSSRREFIHTKRFHPFDGA